MTEEEKIIPAESAFKIAVLILADGTVFEGEAFGDESEISGEVVFNTAMTGYQEILSDPSYRGQIVVMTYPMIGNYGINPEDMESERPQVSGVVVRELSRHPSNWRSTRSLDEWLAGAGIPVIEGVDTRRLTRHLRERGLIFPLDIAEIGRDRGAVAELSTGGFV